MVPWGSGLWPLGHFLCCALLSTWDASAGSTTGPDAPWPNLGHSSPGLCTATRPQGPAGVQCGSPGTCHWPHSVSPILPRATNMPTTSTSASSPPNSLRKEKHSELILPPPPNRGPLPVLTCTLVLRRGEHPLPLFKMKASSTFSHFQFHQASGICPKASTSSPLYFLPYLPANSRGPHLDPTQVRAHRLAHMWQAIVRVFLQ